MFKTKNIKKFVSIVCITLTQQHIYPILQNSTLQAINFTVENDEKEEYLTVTLKERLHCLIVQPQRTGEPDIHYQDNNSRLLLGVRRIDNRSKVKRTTTGTQHLGEEIRKILSTSKDYEQVLLTLQPNDLNESNIPDLPYTQLRLPAKLTDSLTTEALEKLITKYPTLKTTLNDQDYIPIVGCQTSPNTEHLDKKILWSLDSQQMIPPTPDQLNEIVPKQLKTVGKLRTWLSEHNPEFWKPFAANPIEPRPESPIVPHKAPEEIKLNQQSEEQNEALIQPNISTAHKTLNCAIPMRPHTEYRPVPPTNSQPITQQTNLTAAAHTNSTNIGAAYVSEGPLAIFVLPGEHDTNDDETTLDICNMELGSDNVTGELTALPQKTSDHAQLDVFEEFAEAIAAEGPSCGPSFLCKAKHVIRSRPNTSLTVGVGSTTLLGTLIYKLTKLFSRNKSKATNKKNVISSHHNNHVGSHI